MPDFPASLVEFQRQFPDDEASEVCGAISARTDETRTRRLRRLASQQS